MPNSVARRSASLAFSAGLALLLLGSDGAPSAADLVYREVSVAGVQGHLLEVDLATASLRVLDATDHGSKALTAQQFAETTGAAAVFNGPFFDVDGSPMGLLVIDGQRKQPVRRADWGVFYVAGGKASIVHTSEYGAPSGVQEAFQVGPRLVVAGEVLALKPQTARRTAVCVRDDGRVLALVTSGSVQASSLAAFLKEQGCRDALNLDGGPSSQMWVSSGGVRVSEAGGTAIPIAVGVFPGQPAAERTTRRRGCGG